ncbi:armadillo-type protein [Dactylonectria estremocensis]|uniref:Armadillo-type protein n=1 Tax=Dactylonectria estremocensis TaxID=1079267 RepID=A0A9P9FEA1_9HYPO|nr:armadillo-type protein [Dactylonectria estremocensis]
MESTPSSQERNEFFQKLKPWCVKLSQLTIRDSDGPTPTHQLNELMSRILAILNDQIQQNPTALDDKLAEYVFFPLYHIFRQMDRYPMSLMENSLKCLTILIIHGWKSKISAQLVQQILNLLTFIINGTPGSTEKHTVDEETVLEAFSSLTALLTTASLSASATAGLSESDAIPALGHSVSVILDGVVDGLTPQIQQEALRALQAVYLTVKEHEALASFLPGTLSSLVKVSSTPARYKMNVLAKCIDTVSLVLTRVLSDLRTRSILAKAESEDADETQKGRYLSPAWLKATVAQVKLALLRIMKLRTQDSPQVRGSLNKLCITLLDECHTSLENSTTFLVETAIILDEGGPSTSWTETSLEHLASIYPELGETVKTTTYNWMSSLARIMQAADEDVKQQAIHNLLKGLELAKRLQIESSTLEDSISSTLTNSIVSLVQASKPTQLDENINIRLIGGSDSTTEKMDPEYPPVLLPAESQKGVRNEMMSLVGFLGSSSQQARLASSMLEQAQESTSISQVASFWLCFQICKASHASSAEDEVFLDFSSLTNSPEDLDGIFNELYSTSVQILDRHSEAEPIDRRLEALALEVTAYTAQKAGKSFRPELIDVLFPIATFLGSTNQHLQKHSIITLNSLAASCEYGNVSELIIDNVDYMVNSVSLRLNTLDISPASINVLTMMIRLAGPRLVPYLDDVIESVFGALENYHGYPIFVESLFTVLKEVVDQGVKSDMLLLEHQKTTKKDHRKRRLKANGLSRLLETLAKRKEQAGLDDTEKVTGHPTTPWKAEDAGSQGDSTPDAPEEEKPPNSPTYQLLLRVANLTQHYLTSPTPALRRSLLELLTTASTALAPDEEAFLPVVNAVWPVVVDRLQDAESFIVIEACHALSGLCTATGNFLSSRFKTEWRDWLRDWCRKAKRQASSASGRPRPHGDHGKIMGLAHDSTQILIPSRGQGGLGGNTSQMGVSSYSGGSLGQFGSPAKIWEAAVELLTAMVLHVDVDEEMFDDVLDLLSEALERNKQARDALEMVNADAVWLARYERGAVEWQETPQMDGVEYVEMEQRE